MNVSSPSRPGATRSRAALFAFVSATVAIYGVPAQAQQSEIEVLRAQIAELQNRLNTIEDNQKKAADTTRATPPITARQTVNISGLLQVHSLNFLNEDVNNGGTRGTDTFRLRRGEIRITAPSITPRVSGTLQIDPAKAAATRNTSGGTSATRLRDNVLQEIQISYQLNRNATNTNSNFVDVGQYKIPIGYESLVSSGGLQNVERALIFTQRDPFSDTGYGDVRDTGIQLRGTLNQFDYRIGVFNGFGDRQNGLALSDAKAVLARLAYRPAFAPGLEVGVSGGRGRTGADVTLGTGATAVVNPRVDRDLLNFFAAYKKNKLTLQGEYLRGDSQDVSTAVGTPPVQVNQTRDISGFYGHVGYLFTPKLEATLRLDRFNGNRRVTSDSRVEDLTLGLNYYIKSNNAKIQTNLVRRDSDGGGGLSSALRNDRYELRTNFQISF